MPQTSKSELIMRELLDMIFPDEPHEDNYRPDWLKVTSRHPAELDRYYPAMKLAFEFQGDQHYRFVPFIHKDYAAFEKLIARDEAKKLRCRRRRVFLCYVHKENLTIGGMQRLIEGLVRSRKAGGFWHGQKALDKKWRRRPNPKKGIPKPRYAAKVKRAKRAGVLGSETEIVGTAKALRRRHRAESKRSEREQKPLPQQTAASSGNGPVLGKTSLMATTSWSASINRKRRDRRKQYVSKA